MTTVLACAEGGVMVSDSLSHDPNMLLVNRTKKIFRVCFEGSPALVGGAGHQSALTTAIRWVNDGMPDERPEFYDGEDFDLLLLTCRGLFTLHPRLELLEVHDDAYAVGSGGGPALGALAAGATPTQAVEIACKIDLRSGPPVASEKLWATTEGG